MSISPGADLGPSARRGAGFPGVVHEEALLPTFLCSLQHYYPIPLLEMVQSACSPFCYVLYIIICFVVKFISAFYHVCVTRAFVVARCCLKYNIFENMAAYKQLRRVYIFNHDIKLKHSEYFLVSSEN